jgi:hypothetical protein
MYSSIQENERSQVIESCYWPLLELAKRGVPIGIEAPAVTLEIINKISPDWIDCLRKHIQEGSVEFIGSGYSQLIGPLVPAKVNNWNQIIGLDIYKNLLGVKPEIALINEMAYSAGLIDHYIDNGYKAILMEWNNPRSGNAQWDNKWRYFPQIAIGAEGSNIPIMWADSIAFQKFQRYAHGEINLEEYIAYLKMHLSIADGYFPLYSNDIEIFDYRPGRYQTEAKVDKYSEWEKIFALYEHLQKQEYVNFVFPSEVLNGPENSFRGNEIRLESTAQPIPVKKQEKYNINRWALTGRDDLGINSICYKNYNILVDNLSSDYAFWKELCYLWSSDFRTHITELRWDSYLSRLELFTKKLNPVVDTSTSFEHKSEGNVKVTENNKYIRAENSKFNISVNKKKGLSIGKVFCKELSEYSLFGTLDHGYFDDISLGADYYSGHAIIEVPGEHKVTDLGPVSSNIIMNRDGALITASQETNVCIIDTEIQVDNECITITKSISADEAKKLIIRPVNFTFNPDAWDKKSLFLKMHNGGKNAEIFYLYGNHVSHGDIYSSLISARHGYGNTEGSFIVGDKFKSITFLCTMSQAALIPSVVYKEMDETYFFRLNFSAREMDETIKKSQSAKRKTIKSELKILI